MMFSLFEFKCKTYPIKYKGDSHRAQPALPTLVYITILADVCCDGESYPRCPDIQRTVLLVQCHLHTSVRTYVLLIQFVCMSSLLAFFCMCHLDLPSRKRDDQTYARVSISVEYHLLGWSPVVRRQGHKHAVRRAARRFYDVRTYHMGHTNARRHMLH